MSQWPRITLVTPSFNQGAFLEETIRSVLGQEYADLEYFVMDGGSSDGSAEIIRRYADRLTGWVSEKDGGHADGVNKGLTRSTGEVLGYLNSDDVLFPGALRRVGGWFAEHPDACWMAGACQFFADELLPPDCPHQLEVWRPRPGLGALDFLEGCPIPQPAVFWRRRAWEAAGPFSGRIASLDYEYWLRLLALGFRPKAVPDVLAGWRLHAGSLSVARLAEGLEANMATAWEYLPRLCPDGEERRRVTRHLEAVFGLTRAQIAFRRGERGPARRLALRSVASRPGLLRRRSTWGCLARTLLPEGCARALIPVNHWLRGVGTDPRAAAQRPFRGSSG